MLAQADLESLVVCVQSPFFFCLRAAGAGVMLSVAFVHTLPEGAEDLDSMFEFPLAPCLMMAGV